jgi:hypothetical protein
MTITIKAMFGKGKHLDENEKPSLNSESAAGCKVVDVMSKRDYYHRLRKADKPMPSTINPTPSKGKVFLRRTKPKTRLITNMAAPIRNMTPLTVRCCILILDFLRLLALVQRFGLRVERSRPAGIIAYGGLFVERYGRWARY